MTNLFKNISVVVVIAMIISIITIPAFAYVNALSYSVGSVADDNPRNLVAWVTLSYSGANGVDEVFVNAQAVTNLGLTSTIDDSDTAIAASFSGNPRAYKLEIPFVIYTSGSASYTDN